MHVYQIKKEEELIVQKVCRTNTEDIPMQNLCRRNTVESTKTIDPKMVINNNGHIVKKYNNISIVQK